MQFENHKHKTCYGQTWSLVIVDEAHVGRKYNRMYIAFYALREKSFGTVAMTATPVMTSPMVHTRLYFPILVKLMPLY